MMAGKPQRIRLYGIDCPEKGQDWGQKAKQATADLVQDRIVQIVKKDTDRYGRIVAEIILPDGQSLNQELVKLGLAWWYIKYAPKDQTLKSLENNAREAKIGLWSTTNPVPPWQWRHQKR